MFLIIFNDNHHTSAYVVDIIVREFSTTREIAFFISVMIHERGKISIELPDNASAVNMQSRILKYGADVEAKSSTGPLRVEVLTSEPKNTYRIGKYDNAKLEIAPEALKYKKSRRIFMRVRRQSAPISRQVHMVTLLIAILSAGGVLGLNVTERVEPKNWISIHFRGWPMNWSATAVTMDAVDAELNSKSEMKAFRILEDTLARSNPLRTSVNIVVGLALVLGSALCCEVYLRRIDRISLETGSADTQKEQTLLQ